MFIFEDGFHLIISLLWGMSLLGLINFFFFKTYWTDKYGNSHKIEDISIELRVFVVFLYGAGFLYFLRNPTGDAWQYLIYSIF